MAESTTTPGTEGTNPQTAPMEQSGGGNEPKTFTQEDVDRIVKERLARAKHEPPADYEEFRAKAARLDEIEEARKSDLEKANDAASKAKAKADEWKAKYEAMQAENERTQAVAQFASQYKVDAGTLSRMSGDVEDNAKYLAGIEAARPKYPTVTDDGGRQAPQKTVDDALKGVKSYAERIKIRKQYLEQNQER